ncbi:MAG TPA: protein translocase SEC61 complex subunit gamma [Candidatus Pacearchaeota archaeon]|nr:protein translocase SEC61 complex subunit gamma [Candidatus Pacearchaeota archaeon]
MVRKHYENFKSFAAKSRRVWLSLKKPSKKEFWSVAKISAIGILILGAIGFLVSIIMKAFV